MMTPKDSWEGLCAFDAGFAKLYACGRVPKELKGATTFMFVSRTSIIVTALCALVGISALVGIHILALMGGSEYTKFALVMVFFVSFLVGSYWWIVFGGGRFL